MLLEAILVVQRWVRLQGHVKADSCDGIDVVVDELMCQNGRGCVI